MKGKGGFTLIELLVVIIILGVLAAIALPKLITGTEKARTSEAVHILGALRSSELRYKATDSTGNYATDLTKLDANYTTPKYWNFAVDGTGNLITATRTGTGSYVGNTITIDVTTGTFGGTHPDKPAANP